MLLSRWKVDDAATALLMARFYENLMRSRTGTKPLGRAAALAEAKAWLRKLSRTEATKRLAVLVDGVLRGERSSLKAPLPNASRSRPRARTGPLRRRTSGPRSSLWAIRSEDTEANRALRRDDG